MARNVDGVTSPVERSMAADCIATDVFDKLERLVYSWIRVDGREKVGDQELWSWWKLESVRAELNAR